MATKIPPHPRERVVKAPPLHNPLEPADLSSLVSPPFKYALVDPETGERQEVTVPFDDVAFDLGADLPTLFRPTGEQDKEGNLIVGFTKVLLCLQAGEAPPASLPSIQQIIITARRALNVPQGHSKAVVMATLMKWMEIATERAAAKKGMPDSHGSSAPTPASSGSKASARTS